MSRFDGPDGTRAGFYILIGIALAGMVLHGVAGGVAWWTGQVLP